MAGLAPPRLTFAHAFASGQQLPVTWRCCLCKASHRPQVSWKQSAWLGVLTNALGWDEVPVLCLKCWKLKNGTLYSKYQSAHQAATKDQTPANSAKLSSATSKLARVYVELEAIVFFVVMVNVPTEDVQDSTRKKFLGVLPTNVDAHGAYTEDALKKYSPKRGDPSTWWVKLTGLSCAPWLVPLNELEHVMEALVAIEVHPVLTSSDSSN